MLLLDFYDVHILWKSYIFPDGSFPENLISFVERESQKNYLFLRLIPPSIFSFLSQV